MKSNPAKVIQPSLQQFTQQQASSALKLLNEICAIDSSEIGLKEQFAEEVKKSLAGTSCPKGNGSKSAKLLRIALSKRCA